MRHRVSHRKLGRVTEHRIAMLRNQAEALIKHEHIETTMPKAKELRPFVERIITIAKRGLAGGRRRTAQALHARRLVLRDIQDSDVVSKLFDTIAPRFEARPGGYTRILRLGFRRGDSADVAQIELVGSEYNPNAAEKGEKAEAKRSPRASAAVSAPRPSGCAARRPTPATDEPDRAGQRRRPSRAARRASPPSPTLAARQRRRRRRRKAVRELRDGSGLKAQSSQCSVDRHEARSHAAALSPEPCD